MKKQPAQKTEFKKVKDLVQKKITGLSSYNLNPKDGESEVCTLPFINISDLSEGVVTTDTIKEVKVRVTKKAEENRVNAEDVIVTLRGTSLRSAMVDKEAEGAVVSSNVVALRFKKELLPEIAVAWFNSPSGQSTLHSLAGGGTIQGLKLSELMEISIPVPPMEIQRDIVAFYKAIQERRSLLKREEELLDSVVQLYLENKLVK